MKILLTPADIKAICERPTKLRTYATANEYEMERYMNVAREAVITALHNMPDCVLSHSHIDRRCELKCGECWLAYLERDAEQP